METVKTCDVGRIISTAGKMSRVTCSDCGGSGLCWVKIPGMGNQSYTCKPCRGMGTVPAPKPAQTVISDKIVAGIRHTKIYIHDIPKPAPVSDEKKPSL